MYIDFSSDIDHNLVKHILLHCGRQDYGPLPLNRKISNFTSLGIYELMIQNNASGQEDKTRQDVLIEGLYLS